MKGEYSVTEQVAEARKEFIERCSVIQRDGIDKLMEWLNGSDFYVAPASRQYHGCYEGGLCQHSLNVFHQLKRVLQAFPEYKFEEETLAIVSLFHDLCKVNFYVKEKRNRKNEFGQWESYDAYKIEEKFKFGGHGSKSVFLIQNFIKLTPEEAVAINNHMGAFGDNAQAASAAYEAYPLAWLLHVADEAATYIVEKE